MHSESSERSNSHKAMHKAVIQRELCLQFSWKFSMHLFENWILTTSLITIVEALIRDILIHRERYEQKFCISLFVCFVLFRRRIADVSDDSQLCWSENWSSALKCFENFLFVFGLPCHWHRVQQSRLKVNWAKFLAMTSFVSSLWSVSFALNLWFVTLLKRISYSLNRYLIVNIKNAVKNSFISCCCYCDCEFINVDQLRCGGGRRTDFCSSRKLTEVSVALEIIRFVRPWI